MAFTGTLHRFLMLSVLLGLVAQAGAQVDRFSTIDGITEPSETRKLAFPGLGIVSEVLVREGDRISAGQVLLAQDAFIETKELERAHREAESNMRIEAAEADLAHKRVVLARKEDMASKGVASDSEVEEARLEALVAEKRLELAREEQLQARLKVEQHRHRISTMQIRSPVDGQVVRVEVGVGEIAEPSKPVIHVVSNDPLKVVIRGLTTSQVARLSLGQVLEVRYPDEQTWRKARVSFISPVADAASGTQLVKLDLDNPHPARAAGLAVLVRLPEEVAQAGSSIHRSPGR